jgi:hypothetical protein
MSVDPLERPERLRELVRDAELAESLRVRVSIFGGVASQRLRVDADITGQGQVAGSIQDELTGRAGDFAAELPGAERQRLLELLAGDDFAAPGEPRLFPPDTVIGRITVVLGDGPVGTYRDAVDLGPVGRARDETTSVGDVLTQVLEFAEAMVPLP